MSGHKGIWDRVFDKRDICMAFTYLVIAFWKKNISETGLRVAARSKYLWLVGLDLFNDDTRTSGHISRPTQVNVSQSCFHSLNNYSSLIILYTSGGKLKLINYIISDRRIPLLAGILLCKSQELSRREHSTSQLCSIHHGIPVTMHTPAAYGQLPVFDHNGDNQLAVLGTEYGIWWPWYGQFEVGWLLQPLQLWLGAGTSSVAPVLVSQDRDLCHVQLHLTWFEPTSECRSWPMVSYLYCGHLPVGLYLCRGSLELVGPLFHFRQCHSGLVETNTCALVTQWPEQVHDMANKRVLGVFTLNCLQTGHWVRVDCYIMMDWAHVLVIVQCQTDGCSLSCKDGAIVKQTFGQLGAGCLTILEMAVDDRRCPHSLVHFGAISVDFIMWSLCFTKLVELSLGFLSRDHAFTYSFNEVVSLGI